MNISRTIYPAGYNKDNWDKARNNPSNPIPKGGTTVMPPSYDDSMNGMANWGKEVNFGVRFATRQQMIFIDNMNPHLVSQ